MNGNIVCGSCRPAMLSPVPCKVERAVPPGPAPRSGPSGARASRGRGLAVCRIACTGWSLLLVRDRSQSDKIFIRRYALGIPRYPTPPRPFF